MDLSDIIIRYATIDDCMELARLRWDFSTDVKTSDKQNLMDFQQSFADFLNNALSSDSWCIVVAEFDGKLVGNIYVQIIPKVPRPGRFNARYGYVTNVYVESQVRGSGIGSGLIKKAIEWAKNEELEFLIVWPSEESIEFYKRLGFNQSPDAMELHF